VCPSLRPSPWGVGLFFRALWCSIVKVRAQDYHGNGSGYIIRISAPCPGRLTNSAMLWNAAARSIENICGSLADSICILAKIKALFNTLICAETYAVLKEYDDQRILEKAKHPLERGLLRGGEKAMPSPLSHQRPATQTWQGKCRRITPCGNDSPGRRSYGPDS